METHAPTLTHAREAAHEFMKQLPAPKQDGALVVALYGDLGAGKTTFVQHVAELFGITERVISPTFILERIYTIPEPQPFNRFVHIDAYRLEGGCELEQLGWSELIAHSGNIVFVEWADRVEDALPDDAIKIYFEFEGEEGRKIVIRY